MTCAGVHRRQPHVPFEPIEQRGVREVRRADERGAQARTRARAATPSRAASSCERRTRPAPRHRARTSASTALRCVAPMYVVVITRIRPPRSTTPASASRRRTTPLQITNAQSRSTESADSSSSRSSLPMFGWPSAFTSRSLLDNGTVGAGMAEARRRAARPAANSLPNLRRQLHDLASSIDQAARAGNKVVDQFRLGLSSSPRSRRARSITTARCRERRPALLRGRARAVDHVRIQTGEQLGYPLRYKLIPRTRPHRTAACRIHSRHARSSG